MSEIKQREAWAILQRLRERAGFYSEWSCERDVAAIACEHRLTKLELVVVPPARTHRQYVEACCARVCLWRWLMKRCHFSHTEIAELWGLSRPAVSKALKRERCINDGEQEDLFNGADA